MGGWKKGSLSVIWLMATDNESQRAKAATAGAAMEYELYPSFVYFQFFTATRSWRCNNEQRDATQRYLLSFYNSVRFCLLTKLDNDQTLLFIPRQLFDFILPTSTRYLIAYPLHTFSHSTSNLALRCLILPFFYIRRNFLHFILKLLQFYANDCPRSLCFSAGWLLRSIYSF